MNVRNLARKAWARPERRWMIFIVAVTIGLGVAAAASLYPKEGWFIDWLESARSIATVLGIVLAGAWFLQRRQHYPRAEISHAMARLEVEGGKLLVVQTKFVNKGVIKIELRTAEYQLRRVPERDIGGVIEGGSLVGGGDIREVEGGESEEFWREFSIGDDVKHVSFYTCFGNSHRDDGMHWDKKTYFSVGDGKTIG